MGFHVEGILLLVLIINRHSDVILKVANKLVTLITCTCLFAQWTECGTERPNWQGTNRHRYFQNHIKVNISLLDIHITLCTLYFFWVDKFVVNFYE